MTYQPNQGTKKMSHLSTSVLSVIFTKREAFSYMVFRKKVLQVIQVTFMNGFSLKYYAAKRAQAGQPITEMLSLRFHYVSPAALYRGSVLQSRRCDARRL